MWEHNKAAHIMQSKVEERVRMKVWLIGGYELKVLKLVYYSIKIKFSCLTFLQCKQYQRCLPRRLSVDASGQIMSAVR